MSNCIEIIQPEKIALTSKRTDLERLRRDVNRVQSVRQPPGIVFNGTEQEVNEYYLWWFFDGEFTEDRVVINIKSPRMSGWTWRDFRGFITTLNNYNLNLDKLWGCTIDLVDEADGYDTVFNETVFPFPKENT